APRTCISPTARRRNDVTRKCLSAADRGAAADLSDGRTAEAGEVLMTANGWFQIALYFVVVLAITKPLGVYMARFFERKRTFMDPVCRPVEKLIYRLTGVDEHREMRWSEYALAMLLFSLVTLLVLYFMQRIQAWLPFNPQHLGNIIPHSAFNTAVSFTTNTNWQSYVPETTMSYFTQMAGLAYHNFVSAAVGVAVAI